MKHPKLRDSALLRDTRGLTTVEYVILLALIAVVCVGTWKTFGTTVKKEIKHDNDALTTAFKPQSG